MIIYNVLCPIDSLGDSESNGKDITSHESKNKVGGRKLQKESLLQISTDTSRSRCINLIPLYLDYLDIGEATRQSLRQIGM
jgi:hypothetical protein